jgi:hypothetical protein
MKSGERYEEALSGYRQKPSAEAGQKLREAALERADRREWAQKKRGDERRWQE